MAQDYTNEKDKLLAFLSTNQELILTNEEKAKQEHSHPPATPSPAVVKSNQKRKPKQQS